MSFFCPECSTTNIAAKQILSKLIAITQEILEIKQKIIHLSYERLD
jgi:hypothetical protein